MLLYPSVNKLQDKTDSRYSLCILTAKRARDIIDGATPLVSAEDVPNQKPLSIAIEELYQGKLKIVAEDVEE